MFDSDMIFRIPALLVALTVHEYAHARVAVALGDPTPRFDGRLTLNPLPHLDPIGLIMLFLVQFGWAKPVQINPRNFKDWKQGTMYVSLAGPAANLLAAFIAIILMSLCFKFGVNEYWLLATLRMILSYNIMFAVFNMLPVPPLDGSKVLLRFLPPRLAYQYESYGQYGSIILILLVYMNVVGFILTPIIRGIMTAMMTVVSVII